MSEPHPRVQPLKCVAEEARKEAAHSAEDEVQLHGQEERP